MNGVKTKRKEFKIPGSKHNKFQGTWRPWRLNTGFRILWQVLSSLRETERSLSYRVLGTTNSPGPCVKTAQFWRGHSLPASLSWITGLSWFRSGIVSCTDINSILKKAPIPETAGAHLTNRVQFMRICFKAMANLPSVTKNDYSSHSRKAVCSGFQDRQSSLSPQAGPYHHSLPHIQVGCHYQPLPFFFLTRDQNKEFPGSLKSHLLLGLLCVHSRQLLDLLKNLF